MVQRIDVRRVDAKKMAGHGDGPRLGVGALFAHGINSIAKSITSIGLEHKLPDIIQEALAEKGILSEVPPCLVGYCSRDRAGSRGESHPILS